jgi:hypothetical protein
VLRASLDRDEAALGEVLAADPGLVVEDDDVDVVGAVGHSEKLQAKRRSSEAFAVRDGRGVPARARDRTSV